MVLSTKWQKTYLFFINLENEIFTDLKSVQIGPTEWCVAKEKVVNVRMAEDCHQILKAYCAFVGKTMSEVMYDWARQELHQQSLYFIPFQSMLDAYRKERDSRTLKPCWGFRCNICNHETKCRVGLEDELFIIKPQFREFVKEPISIDVNGLHENAAKN